MIRQYFAQRSQGGTNPLRVGVVAAGSIVYLQDEGFFRDRHGGRAICRTPWIIESFLNGQCHAARRDPATGRWVDTFVSGRSVMAVVHSLRNGRCQQVDVRTLQLHHDLGLSKEPTRYPPFPDLRFYRRQARCQLMPMRRAA